MDLDPGTIVANRYRISRPLGRGGMGEVFAAEHIRTGRPVAIKLLRQDSKAKATAVKRFQQEARAAGQINSDHVTQVLDVEEDPDHGVVLVFELLEGESLIDRLKRTGPIPFDELWPIIEQVWMGLADAHRAGIIHRDLKPSNVFLERRPDGTMRVKILDFGISKVPKEAGGETLTEMGQSLGTFSFMPPEQIGKAKTVDHRADIYACSTLIYQSLTGQLPYAARNILVMVEMKSKTDARKLSDAMGGPVDPRLEAFVARGLAREASQRFSTAVEALAAWRELRPTAAPVSGQPTSSQPARTRSQPPPAVPEVPAGPPHAFATGDPHVSSSRSASGSLPRVSTPVIMESAGALPRVNSDTVEGGTTDETGATLAMPVQRLGRRGAEAQGTPPLVPRVEAAAASLGSTTPMRTGSAAEVSTPRMPVGPGGTQPVTIGRALDHLRMPQESSGANPASPAGYYPPHAAPAAQAALNATPSPATAGSAQASPRPVATGRSGLPVAYEEHPAGEGDARTQVYRPDETGRRASPDATAQNAQEAKAPGTRLPAASSPAPAERASGLGGNMARPSAPLANAATQPKRTVPILVVLVGFLLVGFAVVAGAIAFFKR